jgi:hypothetical protein
VERERVKLFKKINRTQRQVINIVNSRKYFKMSGKYEK